MGKKKCNICNKLYSVKRFNLKYMFSKREEEQIHNIYNTVDWCMDCTKNKTIKEYKIHALARSGHHAIITWICNQLIGRTHISRNILKRLRKRIKGGSKLQLYGYDNHVYAIEDRDLEQAEKLLSIKKVKEIWSLRGKDLTTILVLRDPWNMFASRLSMAKKLSWWNPYKIDEWKNHAREFLGETSFLQNPLFINYNMWFTDLNYRKQISKKLGVEFRDDGLNRMMKSSSFEGMKFQGKAQNMDVLNRWKQIKLPQIFNDSELFDLSERIFGDIAPSYFKR